MPATSEAQRRLMAMALRHKRGELSKPSVAVKKVAKGMSEGQLRDFAVKSRHHAKPFRYHKGRST